MTPQEVADAITAAGIGSPEELTAILKAAGPLVRRNVLLAQVEKAKADRRAADESAGAAIASLQNQVDSLDAMFRDSLGTGS